MSELRIESFAPSEKPVEAFFELVGRVEGLNEGQAKAERKGTLALLDPSRAFFKNAEAKSFVVFRGDKAVGRVTAFHNHLLVNEKLRFGLVGLFACENDVEAAKALMKAAADYLAERNLTAIRGPMAGDIWHRWRLMTRGFETDPFPGEPRNPKYYADLFSACGFAAVRTYSTKLVTDLEGQLARFAPSAALNTKRGYSFRNVTRADWEADMQHIYELCRHSFATRWSVTETTYEDFAEVYNRWLRRVGAEQIVLALDKSKAVVGLGLAVTAPADTLNIRTVAVYPHAAGFGLGQAIGAELYRRAIAAGIKKVHHCLMSPNTAPQFWDHGLGSVTREYTMYERSI
jgi:GNAT superfamily N-acetyltransferase